MRRNQGEGGLKPNACFGQAGEEINRRHVFECIREMFSNEHANAADTFHAEGAGGRVGPWIA